uniref:Transmembrane protein 183A-like n=1 Tax=Sinocyclocheilus grahami TaxID=75366 RepID=A0A672K772_SINGR
ESIFDSQPYECIDGEEYPIDIWLLLAAYIRPEDVCRFSLICKNAWTATCTAAFWTRLYKRHYNLDADLPDRLQPDSVAKMRCLRARVIRSLFHLYEPFSLRVSKSPPLPESTPTTLLNSKCLLCWVNKVSGSRSELMWEFNFKFVKLVYLIALILSDFLFQPTKDMRHHRVRLDFQDSPVIRGKKFRGEQGVQVVLDPVHSVRLMDWWHPQYPTSSYN